MSNDIYQHNADSFFKQYESVTSEQVHAFWLPELDKRAIGTALDVGAGSGRDAKFLAAKGWRVIAVEPANSLRELAIKSEHLSDIYKSQTYLPIDWIADTLPNLSLIKVLNLRYDLILLSAVLMHLNQHEQQQALNNLSYLLNIGGILVMTLRVGEFSDGRIAYPIDVEKLIAHAEMQHLKLLTKSQLVTDQLGRSNVTWQTIVLTKE